MARVRFPSPAPPPLRWITFPPGFLYAAGSEPLRATHVPRREDGGCVDPALAAYHLRVIESRSYWIFPRVRHPAAPLPGAIAPGERDGSGCSWRSGDQRDRLGTQAMCRTWFPRRCEAPAGVISGARRMISSTTAATDVSRTRVRRPGVAATWPSIVRSPHAGTRRTGGSRPVAARPGRRDPGVRRPRRRRSAPGPGPGRTG